MHETHRRSELVEIKAGSELFAAAGPAVRERLGLRAEPLDGALALIAGHDPSILLNRVIGLGTGEPATEETIVAIKKLYAQAGVGRYFVHVHPEAGPPQLRSWLEAAGFRPHRRWMKFVRGRKAPPEPSTDLHIEAVGPEHAPAFGRIVAQGFDLTEAAVPMLAGLVHRSDWRLYVSFSGDQPAGAGAMFVQDGIAYLDWGATLPAWRKRGSQRAVLARRIRDALDLGCTLMVTTTGEAVPGDPQHSYRNIEWAGFEPAYLHDNFVPA